MNRQSLISLTTAAIAVVMAGGANAQETPTKQNSIGPAIEFSGGGTSFGIKGKVGVSPQISVRPMVLFGYTPSVSGATFGQAVTSGLNNLTAPTTPTREQQIAAAIFANPTLSRDTAAALLDKKDPTESEKAAIAKAQTPVPFYTTLSPEKQIATLQSFSAVKLTDSQADAIANKLVEISKIDAAKRTPEQTALVSVYLPNGDLTTFVAATAEGRRTSVKTTAVDTLSPDTARSILSTLDAGTVAQQTPVEQRTTDQKSAISAANNLIATLSNILEPGFAPGSGTAFGLAVTYDFESADKKLSGYVGPRVMFANGSSKIGNFDTSTSETSIGLLVGADYAISTDLTAGLSATYNFSKSGNLDVSGPGGFKGSAPVSGSSLDLGVNFGYRF